MSFLTSKYIKLGEWDGNQPVFSSGLTEQMETWRLTDGKSTKLRNQRIRGYGSITRPGFKQVRVPTGIRKDWNYWLITDDFYLNRAWTPGMGITKYQTVDKNRKRLVVAWLEENGAGQNVLFFIKDWIPVQYDVVQMKEWSDKHDFATKYQFLEIGDDLVIMSPDYPMAKYTNGSFTYDAVSTYSSFNKEMKPAFGVNFASRLCVAGDKRTPNLFFASKAGSSYDFETVDTAQSSLFSGNSIVYSFPETITGMITTAQGLFIFTPSTIHINYAEDVSTSAVGTTYLNFRPMEATEGAVNNKCIVNVLGQVYYLTPSNKINRIDRQTFGYYAGVDASHVLGNGIQETMALLDEDQTDAFAYYDPVNQLVKWHVKTRWAAANNLVIIYDRQRDTWLVDDNKNFTDWVHFNGRNYTLSALAPLLYEDEVLNSDDWQKVRMFRASKEWNIGEPTIKKDFWMTRLYFSMDEEAELIQRVYVDGKLVKEIKWTIDELYANWYATKPIAIDSFAHEYPLDNLIDCVWVVDKDNLGARGTKMTVTWEALGTVWLQEFDMKAEMLDERTTDYLPNKL